MQMRNGKNDLNLWIFILGFVDEVGLACFIVRADYFK
jgi:hypothetical protein